MKRFGRTVTAGGDALFASGLRWLLAVVLLVSGTGKLMMPLQAERLFQIVVGPASWLALQAATAITVLSLAEIALALLFLRRKAFRWALRAFILITLALSAVVGSLVLDGRIDHACGCFGIFSTGGGLGSTLARNTVLVTLALIGLVRTRRARPTPA